jgi:hypothetical protein
LIDSWAEQAVGAYIAQQLDDQGQPEKTATQATIDAKREQEAADIQIRRWLDQISTMTQIQQQRAFSDDAIDTAERIYEQITEDQDKDKPEIYEDHANLDPEVLRTLVSIFQFGISAEEVKVWRESPTSIFAHVANSAVQQGVASIAVQYKDNPNVDQATLTSIDIENKVGAQMAQRILIPNPDQTVTGEASRQQLIEYATMYDIQMPMPVVARDNHFIHCTILQQLLTVIGQQVLSKNPSPDPKLMKSVELALNHFGAHLQFAATLGQLKDPNWKPLEKFYDGFKKQLTEVIQIQQQAQVAAAMVHHTVSLENAAAGKNPDGSPALRLAPPAAAAPPLQTQPAPGAPPPLVTNGSTGAPPAALAA